MTLNAEGFYGVAVIRAYDEAGNVIETHEHKGDFKELGRMFVSPEQRRRGIGAALA